MDMIMRYQISFDSKNFKNELNYIDFGGYTFKINDMYVPFDFDAASYSVENKNGKAYVDFETGRGVAFDSYDIDECFDEEYELLGLSREDITAKFLSSVSEISEFYINCEYKNDDNKQPKNLKIEYIEFQDYKTKEVFKVDENVIKAFNKRLLELLK